MPIRTTNVLSQQILNYQFTKISLRLSTQLWDLETSALTEITPSLPNENYAIGGSFLLSANECRQSGELSLFEMNRPFNLEKSRTN